MFNVGDMVIYSIHGLSRIDDICEKTISNVTKTYYVLHPLDQTNLIISAPIDSDKVVMQKLLDPDEAKEILLSFQQPEAGWIENPKHRYRQYQDIIRTGHRREIAKITRTLMRKDMELHLEHKKLHEQDRKILDPIQNLLFKELAMSLDTTFDKIVEQVNSLIKQ
ncbi:CarD family transcriptional regulator [Neobacillus drentensis]|uniref:CarD family transcriptional regulator n=1 Tax=Neobacillus drentensis TaxID=220684 RepID=UPI001F182FD9|nr:CarD family transcriptional regulator [Neobacillus drentensis]ULT57034.1 CarD family transcriptional regulator [Neobacillus drentensis]